MNLSSKSNTKNNNVAGKWGANSLGRGGLSYKNLKIKQRLMLAFSVIMLFMTINGASSLYSFQRVYKDVEHMMAGDVTLMKIYDNVNFYSARRLAAVRGYFLTNNDSYLNEIEAHTDYLDNEIGKILDRDDSPEVAKTFQEFALLDVLLEEQLTFLAEGGSRGEALRVINTAYNPEIERLTEEITAYSLAQSDLAKTTMQVVLAQIQTSIKIMAVLFVGAFVLGVMIMQFFANSITNPIIRIMDRLKAIGEGKLRHEPFTIPGKGEISELMVATNTLQERLTAIISNIATTASELAQHSEELSQSSNEVKTGAEQVAMTMQELAIGTENQAHSASQMAANMDQFAMDFTHASEGSVKISTASKQVVQLSDQGKDLMNSSSQQMARINNIVQESVDMMSHLDNSTHEINNLVVIIRGIADQTNLLALNAAIEAARAGEHGRGFAVVADEVRKLSEQVAESVKEITVFVENIQKESNHVARSLEGGSTEAKAGLDSLDETRKTFDQITASLNRMVTEIGGINNDILNLSEASNAMGHTISEIASVSEESAAGVEETSAASQEITSTMEEVAVNANQIAEQAEILNNMVSEFQL